MFAGTPVLCQRRELEVARAGDYTFEQLVEFPGVRYDELDGEAEILPGLHVIPTPGHVEGHQSLVVECEDGSVVLAGHPKLKNDMGSPVIEEIGGRTVRFELNGFGKDKKTYLHWLLEQVTLPKTKPDVLLTDAAATLLCERLTTPLQFEFYLTRVFEEAFHVGQKPADADTVAAVLAPDLDGMEARLARNGYDVKVLTEMIAAKPKDIRSFLRGRLPLERTQELHDQLLAVGVPL